MANEYYASVQECMDRRGFVYEIPVFSDTDVSQETDLSFASPVFESPRDSWAQTGYGFIGQQLKAWIDIEVLGDGPDDPAYAVALYGPNAQGAESSFEPGCLTSELDRFPQLVDLGKDVAAQSEAAQRASVEVEGSAQYRDWIACMAGQGIHLQSLTDPYDIVRRHLDSMLSNIDPSVIEFEAGIPQAPDGSITANALDNLLAYEANIAAADADCGEDVRQFAAEALQSALAND